MEIFINWLIFVLFSFYWLIFLNFHFILKFCMSFIFAFLKLLSSNKKRKKERKKCVNTNLEFPPPLPSHWYTSPWEPMSKFYVYKMVLRLHKYVYYISTLKRYILLMSTLYINPHCYHCILHFFLISLSFITVILILLRYYN